MSGIHLLGILRTGAQILSLFASNVLIEQSCVTYYLFYYYDYL